MERIRKEVSDQRKQIQEKNNRPEKQIFWSEVSNQRKWRDPGCKPEIIEKGENGEKSKRSEKT